MGRAANRKRQKRADHARPLLEVAIVTHPRSDPTIAHDLELVRAAVLYADKIELVSLSAVMLGGVAHLAHAGADDMLGLLACFDDETVKKLGGSALPENWREYLPVLSAMLDTDPETLRAFPGGERLIDVQREAASHSHALREAAEGLMQASGVAELLPAIEAGLVSVSHSGLEGGRDTDRVLEGYIDIVRGLLEQPDKRILFDDNVTPLIRALVDEGHIAPHGLALQHAAQASVGSGLIARVPAFPHVPLDELLDLRLDLQGPLTRYRALTVRLAEQLAYRAFDAESHAELDDLWTSSVAPALAEIEESLAEHGLVREVLRATRTDFRTLLREGAGLYLGLGTFASVDEVIAATVAVAGPAADAILKGVSGTRAARRDARGRDLFYLYEISRLAR